MYFKKLTSIILISATLMFSCGPKSRRDSRIFDSAQPTSSVRWMFDSGGGLIIPSMTLNSTESKPPKVIYLDPTFITPGEPREPGTAEGNCHGGGCTSGDEGGLGQDDHGDSGEFSEKRLEDEVAKYNETTKWFNEELKKTTEALSVETQKAEVDRAIKEAESQINQIKDQINAADSIVPFFERGRQYNNDLNQAMIEAAQKHNEDLGGNLEALPDSWIPSPGLTPGIPEGAPPGLTPPHTPEGRKIAETRNFLLFVEREVQRNPEFSEQKQALVQL